MRGQFSSFRSVATYMCAWIEIRDGALLLPCPQVATCGCAWIEMSVAQLYKAVFEVTTCECAQIEILGEIGVNQEKYYEKGKRKWNLKLNSALTVAK